jgi:hypothetical protein
MPVTDSTPDSTQERVNELYWNSTRSVDEIVKELKISRSSLYAAVRPQDAGTSCPECGDAMVFTNRSNREAHAGTCTGCATEAPVSETSTADEPTPRPLSDHSSEPAPSRRWSRWRGDLAAVPRERVAMVGGAAVLGIMVGAVAARIVREMI